MWQYFMSDITQNYNVVAVVGITQQKFYEDPHSHSWIVTFRHTDTVKLIVATLTFFFLEAPKQITTSAS
jgi:hypothetical protein